MAAVMPAPAPATGATATSIATTHPYTCNTCQVAFRSSDGQRTHMHTDWHRYNLKRRITELPPISSETFAEKVLSSQATSRLERERASFEKICQPCQRTYYSENAFTNHLNSGKHKARVANGPNAAKDRESADSVMTDSVMSSAFSMVDDDTKTLDGNQEEKEAESKPADELASAVEGLKVDDSTETPSTPSEANTITDSIDELPITTCLFCTTSSPTLQINLEHMTRTHGLFIPEQRYLVNLEGLIRYLGEKVLVGNICLYCNKAKGGLDGVRTHMRDKGHCMIAFENEEEMLEVGEFYDFRSTYEDDDGDWESDVEILDGDESARVEGEGEGWETDSSVDSDDIGSVPIDPTTSRLLHRTPSHHLSDGWHSHAHVHAIYHTDYELHLPSGRSVGHRSLARYYRQNLGNGPFNREQAQTNNQRLIENGVAGGAANGERGLTRANGGTGLAGAPMTLRKEAAKIERKERKNAERGRGRFQAWVEKKGNSQKHYRDPLLQ